MKLLPIIFSAAAAAGALGLLYMSNQSQPAFTDSADHSQLERYEGVFPSNATRGSDRHIARTEENRRLYAVHFRLPENAPWDDIRNESINRILQKADEIQ